MLKQAGCSRDRHTRGGCLLFLFVLFCVQVHRVDTWIHVSRGDTCPSHVEICVTRIIARSGQHQTRGEKSRIKICFLLEGGTEGKERLLVLDKNLSFPPWMVTESRLLGVCQTKQNQKRKLYRNRNLDLNEIFSELFVQVQDIPTFIP